MDIFCCTDSLDCTTLCNQAYDNEDLTQKKRCCRCWGKSKAKPLREPSLGDLAQGEPPSYSVAIRYQPGYGPDKAIHAKMDDKVPLSAYDSPVHNGLDDHVEKKKKKSKKGRLTRRETNRLVGLRRIDYVLVYDKQYETYSGDTADSTIKESVIKYHHYWKRFLSNLAEEKLEYEMKEGPEGTMYLKLHTTFERLCQEAERMNLELPLEGCKIYDDGPPGCIEKIERKYLITDNEADFVSAPFQTDKMHIFKDIDNEDKFFRPALRSFLTNHILINMDVSVNVDNSKEGILTKKGLPWLIHKGIIKDKFILHDETVEDPAELEELEQKLAESGQKKDSEVETTTAEHKLENEGKDLRDDPRRILAETWARITMKYQPFWKIRNYFGEKIALYFAWSGTLINTLLIPTLFGIAIFIYGLYLSITRKVDVPTSVNNTMVTVSPFLNSTDTDNLIASVKTVVEDSIAIIKEAFDNEVTPYFAFVVCLWGTIFLEIWKRKNATLAYEWDVDTFEDTEPDRPQFIGTHTTEDPVTTEQILYYPMKRRLMKFATSAAVLVAMVVMVFISAAAIILYRVIMTVDYCDKYDARTCLIISTVASSLLNALSILILGKVYDKLAFILTDWENHRTQTQYDDALVLKLFAFQFANSYTSLFYIAFFRRDDWPNGLFGLGNKYQDSCGADGNCMAMLSLQVFILMVAKPLPKFLKDVLLTWFLKKWKARTWCRKKSNKVDSDENIGPELMSFLDRENAKPELGDFTLSEYTEKIIVYGFLMLFAASFPLAPLIALLVNLFDIRVDAKRMLWMYRRPLASIAQDIGMWYNILQFLNVAGVISNAFLIAFTSSWGRKYDTIGRLLIVIIFEHLVFSVKIAIAVAIPDVPPDVKLAVRRHIVVTVKLLLKIVFPDTPSKVKLAKRRHIVFCVKFVIDIAIPDIPRLIRLTKKREKYQVTRILEMANEAKGKSNAPSSDANYSLSNEKDDNKLKRRKSKKKKKQKDSDTESSYSDANQEMQTISLSPEETTLPEIMRPARLTPLKEKARSYDYEDDTYAYDNPAFARPGYDGYKAPKC